MQYHISKNVSTDFENALHLVTESLKEEGFGVLTEINIQEKLKEKLDVNFRKYKILGACNPSYAYEALKLEDKVGVMLPCNVVVQELDDDKIEVSAVNPFASMMAIKNNELMVIASQINDKLKKVINSL